MLKSLLIICLFFVSIANAAEEEYIFKAKGEFAKELKTLMEKYAKEGKVEIQKAPENSGFRTKSYSLIDSFLNNEETTGDIAYGKKIYTTSCATCHGKNAEQSQYNNARILTTLDKKTLIEQIQNYASDPEYGGSTRFLMNQAATALTTDQIVSISAYIYSIKHTEAEAKQPISKETKDNNTAKSSYLQ